MVGDLIIGVLMIGDLVGGEVGLFGVLCESFFGDLYDGEVFEWL